MSCLSTKTIKTQKINPNLLPDWPKPHLTNILSEFGPLSNFKLLLKIKIHSHLLIHDERDKYYSKYRDKFTKNKIHYANNKKSKGAN